MGLGLSNSSGGSGDYLPIITWDARAGRMFRIDRSQGGDGGWVSDKIDITNDRPTMVADLGSIEVGWMAFLPTGPSFKMAPLGSSFPEKPSADHKQGARLKVYSPKNLNGVREFATSAKSVLGAIDALHDAFVQSPEAASGKVPVVQLDGSTSITTKGPNGNVTSYAPVLKILQWVDRPSELGDRTVAAPGGVIAAAPAPRAAAPTSHVPPPAAAAKSSTLADDEIPF